jgi:hypothetical protein
MSAVLSRFEKLMKNVVLLMVMLVLFGSAAMAQNEKCFNFEGGGFTDELRLTVKGQNVAGQLSVSRTNSEMPTRLYQFTGTISKGVITLRFADKKTPTAFAASGDRFTATVTGSKLVLKVWNGTRLAYSATFAVCG